MDGLFDRVGFYQSAWVLLAGAIARSFPDWRGATPSERAINFLVDVTRIPIPLGYVAVALVGLGLLKLILGWARRVPTPQPEPAAVPDHLFREMLAHLKQEIHRAAVADHHLAQIRQASGNLVDHLVGLRDFAHFLIGNADEYELKTWREIHRAFVCLRIRLEGLAGLSEATAEHAYQAGLRGSELPPRSGVGRLCLYDLGRAFAEARIAYVFPNLNFMSLVTYLDLVAEDETESRQVVMNETMRRMNVAGKRPFDIIRRAAMPADEPDADSDS